MICQQMYLPGMINWVCKEVNNFETCQRTKQSNNNYDKLLAKYDEEIPRNKLYFVDLIGTSSIRKKEQKVKLKSKSRYHDRPCNRMI